MNSSNPYFHAIKGSCLNGHIEQKQVMQKGEIGVYLSISIEPAFTPHSSSALPASPLPASVFGFLDVM